MWQPEPTDTHDVVIPPQVADVMEILSQHAHDTWGRKRIEDRWRYGPTRDDEEKLHPNLVPYDQLTDGEKSYDRELIAETIRLLLKLGFTIER